MENFKTQVLIVGAGLFGSMTSKYLKSKGIEVLMVDRKDPQSASKCASGIWRPGWAGKIQEQTKISIPVLEQFVSIDNLPIFDADKEIMSTIDFIDCNNILNEEFIEGDVIRARKSDGVVDSVEVQVEGVGLIEIEFDHLIICAGAMTNQLLARIGVKTLFGLDASWGAVIHSSDKLQRNYIQNWAPYKQLYGLSLIRNGREVSYFTMGSSAKNPPVGGDNRTLAIGEKLVNYAAATGKLRNIVEIPEGLRPIIADKDTDFVNQHGLNVWSATGGAKNSMLLCGYVALKLFQGITESNN